MKHPVLAMGTHGGILNPQSDKTELGTPLPPPPQELPGLKFIDSDAPKGVRFAF